MGESRMIATTLTLMPSDILRIKKENGNLFDEYTLHKLIYSLFPGTQREFLYVDHGGDYQSKSILIISKNFPEETDIGNLESKVISEKLFSFEQYRFEVKLNPVKRESGKKTFIPILGEEQLCNWFLTRQREWGFEVDPLSLEVSDMGLQKIKKGDNTILHNKAIFKGVLQVVDREKFIHSFTKGIGRGKSFGFGLFQIRPIKN